MTAFVARNGRHADAVVVRVRAWSWFGRRHLIATAARNALRQIVGGALRSWRRNLSSGLPALVSTALLLLLTGVTTVLGVSLATLEQTQAQQASLLHVYLRDDVTDLQVAALMASLRHDRTVVSVRYVTSEEAMDRARSRPGLSQLALGASNPFPASLDVRTRRLQDVGHVDAWVRRQAVVDPVVPTSFDGSAYQTVQQVMLAIGIVALVLGALLALVAVTVTANSIRAAILVRRDELKVMQLVGAPRWLVAGPFLVEGGLMGIIAGLLAGSVTVGLTGGAMAASGGAFADLLPGVDLGLASGVAALLIAVGLVLGTGSSMLSIRRHLGA